MQYAHFIIKYSFGGQNTVLGITEYSFWFPEAGRSGAQTHFPILKKLWQSYHNRGRCIIIINVHMTDLWADKQKKRENHRGNCLPRRRPWLKVLSLVCKHSKFHEISFADGSWHDKLKLTNSSSQYIRLQYKGWEGKPFLCIGHQGGVCGRGSSPCHGRDLF